MNRFKCALKETVLSLFSHLKKHTGKHKVNNTSPKELIDSINSYYQKRPCTKKMVAFSLLVNLVKV